MDGLDEVALLKANKGLIVIFTIGIIIANAGLILMTTRKKGFMSVPKWLIFISLAIGDFFLALFSLTLRARYLFEGFKPTCSAFIFADVYRAHFIHFLYGVGLIVLAVELALRCKGKDILENVTRAKIKAFLYCALPWIYSAVPWILGLIVVLPLTMAGMDWEYCLPLSYSRQKAMYALSTCIPAFAAVIVCFVIKFIGLNTDEQQYTQQEILPTYPYTVSQLQNAYLPPPLEMSTGISQPHHSGNQTSHFPLPRHPPNGNANAYLVVDQPEQGNAHRPTNNDQELQSSGINSIAPPDNQPIIVLENPSYTPRLGRERNTLRTVSVVYFCCVIPYAFFSLCYTLNPDAQGSLSFLAFTVMDQIFSWLSLFRSFITPIIFICLSQK